MTFKSQTISDWQMLELNWGTGTTFYQFLIEASQFRFEVQKCEKIGHDLVDMGSHGGPESGHDHHGCTRCGSEWTHRYY